jgi:hypothetical protein
MALTKFFNLKIRALTALLPTSLPTYGEVRRFHNVFAPRSHA